MKHLLVTVTLLISTSTLACPTFKLVDKGDPAPCKGAFFNEAAEKKLKSDYSRMESQVSILTEKLELTELQFTKSQESRIILEAEVKRQERLVQRMKGNMGKGIILGATLTTLLIVLLK